MFGHWTLGMGGKKIVKQSEKHRYQKNHAQEGKSCPKTNFSLCGDFTPLISKSFKSETTSFHYISPKDSESLKILDILLWEVGEQRRFNGTSKVNRQTDRLTDTHMEKSTYRKNRPRGPMLWKVGWSLRYKFSHYNGAPKDNKALFQRLNLSAWTGCHPA